jgi:lysyl-tRNA synthetase class 2
MKGVPGELASCTLAEWLADSGPADDGGGVRLCGRIVQATADSFLFDDGSAAAWWARGDEPAPLAGDLVSLTLRPDARPQLAPRHQQAGSIELLARPPGRGSQFPPNFPPTDGDWFRLRRDRQRLQNLEKRARILAATRRFFDERGFLEIEAPLLCPSPGLELHLSAFRVSPGIPRGPGNSDGSDGSDAYLITSPEYQMKRLLTAGLRRIYSLGKVFRSGELGPHHNPEFTMLEWYRAFAGWQAVADDVAALCEELALLLHGRPALEYRGQLLDVRTPWRAMTVLEAVERHAHLRLRGDEPVDELAQKIRAAGYPLPAPARPGDTDPDERVHGWEDLFFSVFLDHVEPKLCTPPEPGAPARPLILYDWPAPLCALARKKPGSPAVVERFEAYALGLELCNGFGELCDEAEQRQRLERDAQERARRHLPVYPTDERFLGALAEGMPPSGGVALGIDRLVMLLCNAPHIRQVLPFTADEL